MMAIHNSSSLMMALAFAPQSNGWALTDTHMGLWPLAAIAVLLLMNEKYHGLSLAKSGCETGGTPLE